MAYDAELASRLSAALSKASRKTAIEKKMFGGVAFMIDDKMCVGVYESRLMVRVGPQMHDRAINEPGAGVMDFTHRPMLGFLFVDSSGYRTDQDLDKWVRWALDYVEQIPPKKPGPGRRKR